MPAAEGAASLYLQTQQQPTKERKAAAAWVLKSGIELSFLREYLLYSHISYDDTCFAQNHVAFLKLKKSNKTRTK